MKIIEILKDIYSIDEDRRLNYALSKYKNLFKTEIIQYFFVWHCNPINYHFFECFDYINLLEYDFAEEFVSSNDVFELIDYAPSCEHKCESKDNFIFLSEMSNYWPNGSWSAPIIVISNGNKYLTIDGNNRLRMLRMFLKYSSGYKNGLHKIYVLKRKPI